MARRGRVLLAMAALSSWASAGRGPDGSDVSRQLAALGAERAAERAAAQRWLAAHMEVGDLEAAVAAAREGGAEVRRRLALALASDDRHLGLAAELASVPSAPVAEVGRVAIEELVAVWSASSADPPPAPGELPREWGENAPRRLSLDTRGRSLEAAFDVFARLGLGPAPLVLDPRLAPGLQPGPSGGSPAGGERLVGTWNEVLSGLCLERDVSFEVLGYRAPSDEDRRRSEAFVRVFKRGAEAGATPRERLGEWCRGVLTPPDPEWNAACARALAASGWPAAVSWLEERWLASRDPAALEGLLSAAAVGRVAPSLAVPERVAELIEGAERELAERGTGAARALERRAHALAAMGPSAADGRPLAPALVAGWEHRSSASRWIALVALEGSGSSDPTGLSAARAELARAERSEPLARQALAVLARAPEAPGPLVLAEPFALLAWAREHGELEGVLADLVAANARPAGGFAGSPPAEEVGALEWALGVGLVDDAVELWLGLAARPSEVDAVAERLASLAGRGRSRDVDELVRRALERAGSGELAASVRRAALRAGVLDPPERERELERLLALAERSPADLVDLACLAAEPEHGERAREALVEALAAGGEGAGLERAIERAYATLRAARQDGEAEAFSARVRLAARRAGSPLAGRLDEWPTLPSPPPRDLDRADRRVAPELLP